METQFWISKGEAESFTHVDLSVYLPVIGFLKEAKYGQKYGQINIGKVSTIYRDPTYSRKDTE